MDTLHEAQDTKDIVFYACHNSYTRSFFAFFSTSCALPFFSVLWNWNWTSSASTVYILRVNITEEYDYLVVTNYYYYSSAWVRVHTLQLQLIKCIHKCPFVRISKPTWHSIYWTDRKNVANAIETIVNWNDQFSIQLITDTCCTAFSVSIFLHTFQWSSKYSSFAHSQTMCRKKNITISIPFF